MDWRAPSARMQVTTTNPTNTDDSSKGYDVLSFWVNTAATNSFICVDSTLNAARWNQVDSAGVGNSLPSGGNAGEVLVNVSSGQGVWTNTLNVTSINVSNRFTPDLIGTNNGAIGRPIGLTTALTNGPIADLILNSVRFTPTVLTYAGGTNITIDLNAGTIFKLVLTNTAFFATPSNVPGTNSNQTITVQFQQDATGGRSVTWTNGTFKWPGGTVPTITTNAGAISVVTFNNSTFTNAFLLGSALVNFK